MGRQATPVGEPSVRGSVKTRVQSSRESGDSVITSKTRPPGSLGEFRFPIELDSLFSTPEDSPTISTR